MSIEIQKVGVVGSGTIGIGLAQALALPGVTVNVFVRGEESRKLAVTRLDSSVNSSSLFGRMDPDKKADVLSRIRFTTDPAEVGAADVVVEAVAESWAAKQAAYNTVEPHMMGHAVILTVSSSLCVSRLASMTERPSLFGGLHVFNPVPVMRLVEIGLPQNAAPEVGDTAMSLTEKMGKVGLVFRNPPPGYVVNRLLMATINLAAAMYAEQGVAVETIDECMKLGCRHPIGPLATADLIGLDVVRDILDALLSQTGDDRYRPHAIFSDLIDRGLLGAKSGGGFYLAGEKTHLTGRQ